MADLSELESMIVAALPGASAQIVDQGGGDHLAASVVAPQFAGLTRLEQHKLVYAAVQSRADGSPASRRAVSSSYDAGRAAPARAASTAR